MAPENPQLTERDAARAWALAYNTLDPSHLEPLLHDDIRIASQSVLVEMVGPREYLEYLDGKFATFKRVKTEIRVELGETSPYPVAPNPPRPCAIANQDGRPAATVLFEVDGGLISRVDLCMIPPPQTCKGTGIFPGLDDADEGGA